MKVGGVPFTRDSLTQNAKTRLEPFDAVRDVTAQREQAILDRDETLPACTKFMRDLEDALRHELGGTNPDLRRFGFKPDAKRRSPTNQQRLHKPTAEKNDTLGVARKPAAEPAAPEATSPQPPRVQISF